MLKLLPLLTLVAGCAIEPFTVRPLTLGRDVPPAFVPGVNPHNEMRSHIRLPSCGQCHR